MLEVFLKERFGFESFREGQKEVIADILSGQDVFAMLPTGSGKTLCYFVSGLLIGGLTLIVSPLLSLMEDQVGQMKLMGEKKVAALNSFLSPNEKRRLLVNLDQLSFLFISPEMLQMEGVVKALTHNGVQLFVVDEAHCISQWGHDFRPDYLRLNEIKRKLGNPSCLALTATADHRVQQDIISQLDMPNCQKHIYSIDRANIALKVETLGSRLEKYDRMVELVSELQGPGLIYFSSREATEQAAELIRLKTKGSLQVAFYHAGLPSEDRLFIQNQFLNDQLDLVCSTNAFGMGLNKANLRYVIHFHYPQHLNAYVQEMGRAGRDGRPSIAITLLTLEDHQLPEAMIERDFPKDARIDKIMIDVEKSGWSSQNLYKRAIEFGESETAARFLSEQLIYLDPTSLEKSRGYLLEEIEKRKRQKYKDLNGMRRFLEMKTCRREALLKAYDEILMEERSPCCDRCGLLLKDYVSIKGIDHKDSHPLMEAWNERLYKLIPFNQNS